MPTPDILSFLAEQPRSNGWSLLILLTMAHFVCDFTLQGDRMASEKCAGKDTSLPWGWWLVGHGSTHGLAVALLSGEPGLGMAELLAHMGIDRLRCQGRFGLTIDQLLHLACKALWVGWLERG